METPDAPRQQSPRQQPGALPVELPRNVSEALGAHWPWGAPELSAAEVEIGDGRRADAIITLPTTQAAIRLLVEVRTRLAPREVGPLAAKLREYADVADTAQAIVVAPWLSRQTRRALEATGVGYADETGNLWVALEDPAVYVRQEGATRNPNPVGKNRRGLSGAVAAEIARTLIEVRPPYTLEGLVEALPAGPDPGYVSRVLTGLVDDGLIEREPRGPVTDVDVRGLLGAWQEAYDPSKLNAVYRFVDLYGPRNTAQRLVSLGEPAGRWVATGSLVAAALAPVAGPALAKFYTDAPTRLAEGAGLLTAESGTANILLMAPYSPVVFSRTWVDRASGLPCVSPAQTVADLRVGREPEEADALIDWMVANEDAWRANDLSAPSPLTDRGAS